MNIFILDNDPVLAAIYQCDKHIVKMPLESVQMLCIPFWEQNISAPYKLAHKNHPCSKWARHSKANYEWLIIHTNELFKEYTRRYGRIHKSEQVFHWCVREYEKLEFKSNEQTTFAIAMPEFCLISENAVDCYRYYYAKVKKSFARWKSGSEPEWYSFLLREIYKEK